MIVYIFVLRIIWKGRFCEIHRLYQLLAHHCATRGLLTFSEELSQFGITPGQYGVLACLWNKPKLTPKEIASILHVENSTISGVLDRMQRRGLINRLLNPENHRSIYVEATEKGQALQEPVHRKIDELNDMILHNFTKPERAELQNMLRRIGRLVPTEQN